MGAYLSELRYGVRGLLAKPLFSYPAVLILALGIAGNLCIFSVVKELVLRPLPFRDAERLVDLRAASPKRAVPEMGLSPPEYLDYEHMVADTLDGLALYFAQTDSYNLSGDSEPRRLAGRRVTANLFSVLGVAPALGRSFTPAEEKPGGGPVVILSDRVWRRLFGGDPALVGRAVTIDEVPHTVVGIMPAGFAFPSADVEMWLPLGIDAATAPRLLRQFVAVGRLRGGVPFDRARVKVADVARVFEREYPETNTEIEALFRPLYQSIYGENFARSWSIALAAVFSLLVIACANVASLLLIRVTVRQRDLVIRSVLGASRTRLLWSFLLEGLVLAVVAALLAVLLSVWGLGLMKTLLLPELPHASDLRIDGAVLGFAVLLALLTAVICGLIPSWLAARQDMAGLVQQGARTSSGRAATYLRAALVAVELALAFGLLVAAGQLIQSFRNLQQVEIGFEPRDLLSVRLTASINRYPMPTQFIDYLGQVLDEVRAIPGVRSAAVVNELPSSRSIDWAAIFTVEGQPPPPPGQEYIVQHRVVSPGYFHTMGIPLLKGRDFDKRDRLDLPMVVVINEAMAQQHFVGQNPLDKVLKVLAFRLRIVGVVGDVHLTGPRQPVRPAMYFTYTQNPKYTTSIVVRSATDPGALIPLVRAAVSKIDKHQPIYSIATLEQELADDIAQERTLAKLLAVLLAMALILATSGVYAVIAYAVAQRTREVGVRIALGAQRGDVLADVLRRTASLAVVGLGAGLLCSLATNRFLSPLLFDMEPFGPEVYGLLSLLMVAICLIAAYVPARRAASVDPVAALRYE